MPATAIPIQDMPICDVCYESYLDSQHLDTFRRVSVQQLVVCEKCFLKTCSCCGEELPGVALSANGKAYCSHVCMFDDAKACGEVLWSP